MTKRAGRLLVQEKPVRENACDRKQLHEVLHQALDTVIRAAQAENLREKMLESKH